MKQEWRIAQEHRTSRLERLWILNGIWRPTERYRWSGMAMPFRAIGGGAPGDFVGSTADGEIWAWDADYATARSTSAGYSTATTYAIVGQYLLSEEYRVFRVFLKFDTTTIPVGADISEVNLKLTCLSDNSTTDFDVQIIKQDWSAQDPLATANREAAYDNCLAGTQDDSIWRNTAGIQANTQYTSGNLSTSWVNKSGNTYYSLRSSRDYEANEPTGFEHITIATANHTTEEYRPFLSVEFTVPRTPRPPGCGFDPMIF